MNDFQKINKTDTFMLKLLLDDYWIVEMKCKHINGAKNLGLHLDAVGVIATDQSFMEANLIIK